MRLADVRLTAHLRSLNLTAAACLRRTNLQARAFKATTSRRSLANSKHDLTFGAGTEGFQQEQRGDKRAQLDVSFGSNPAFQRSLREARGQGIELCMIELLSFCTAT